MSAFSDDMRQTVVELCEELGNSCVLNKPLTGTGYDPAIGETANTFRPFNTFSAQYNKFAVTFGNDGQNTNLSGIYQDRVIVPWIGEKIDTTWKYNDNNILDVSFIESDNDIIYYTLTIGEKV